MPRASAQARTAKAPPPSTPALQRYRAKRDFALTPEPADTARAEPGAQLAYVIQKHDASHLHYDFRLELDGVLLSWAVPKGPSLDPDVKRMAVRTEDHPLAYANFEGTIPPRQYGAGTVIVWDRGSWQPLSDARAGLAAGKLSFELHGTKLQGQWELVRMKPRDGERQEAWLLFKKRDAQARPQADYDVVQALPDSVLHAPPAAARRARSAAESTADLSAKPPANATAKARTRAPSKARANTPAGATPAPLPDTIEPQLALLATAVPSQGQWLYETKYDGYRLLTRIEGGVPRLITRGGHDWTDRMPALAQALAALGAGTAWLDGEIVVAGSGGGAGNFNALQNAFDCARGPSKHSTQAIEYQLFDLPYFEGHDLRAAPLAARRELLAQWLQARLPANGNGPLHLSPALGSGDASLATALLRKACAAKLEGLIAKRTDAPYRGTRSGSWLKLKCQQRQEFIVGGYMLRSDDDTAIGSLMLGVHDDAGRLRHAGSVGTGWDRAAARALLQRLHRLQRKATPFESGAPASGRWARRTPAETAAGAHWVRPALVVEVAFAEWTPTGLVRHASFVGVRSDKPARDITRDRPLTPAAIEQRTEATMDSEVPTAKAKGKSKATAQDPDAPTSRRRAATVAAGTESAKNPGTGDTVAGVPISHADRVIDAASGLRKIDLVRYYDRVADLILPHLRGRAVALLRAPEGVGAPTFFQKHGGKIGIPGIAVLDPALWPGHEALLEITTRQALLGAAQMNVIEFHIWNSTTRSLLKPDRMIFDLDPGEGVAWPAIQEGAQLVRALLQELGLQSWLKTSGGKGLHVVVPIAARWDFDTVKACSKAIVVHLAQTLPDRFVAKSGPANRKGRIFVDYLRNGEGATTVAPFSARARPGLGVSLPLDWNELPALESAAAWTITNAHERLERRPEKRLQKQPADPWVGMAGLRQSISGPMKALRPSPARAAAG